MVCSDLLFFNFHLYLSFYNPCKKILWYSSLWYLKILYLSVLIFSISSISSNEEVGIFFILISFLLIKGFVNLQSHSVQTEAFLGKGYN